MPLSRICVSVSGLMNEPCSIESTPAITAIFAAASPWQARPPCAPVVRLLHIRSSRPAIVRRVDGSDSDSTPPEGMNLMTSAPYLIW